MPLLPVSYMQRVASEDDFITQLEGFADKILGHDLAANIRNRAHPLNVLQRAGDEDYNGRLSSTLCHLVATRTYKGNCNNSERVDRHIEGTYDRLLKVLVTLAKIREGALHTTPLGEMHTDDASESKRDSAEPDIGSAIYSADALELPDHVPGERKKYKGEALNYHDVIHLLEYASTANFIDEVKVTPIVSFLREHAGEIAALSASIDHHRQDVDIVDKTPAELFKAEQKAMTSMQGLC